MKYVFWSARALETEAYLTLDRSETQPVGAENLCGQAIFVDDATRAVMPPDREMIQVGLDDSGTAEGYY